MSENKEKKTPARRILGEDKKFITKHLDMPEWTDDKIADHLGVSRDGVRAFRRELGGTVRKAVEANTLEEIKEKLRTTTGEEEKKYLYRQEFILSERSKRFNKMFTKDDYSTVVEKWAAYKFQLPEMTISEEDTLEKILVLEIRMEHNQKSMKTCHEHQEVVRKKLLELSANNSGEIDPLDDEGAMLHSTIQGQTAMENDLNKSYESLLAECTKLHKSLNVTREQRESKQKVGAETFLDVVKKLADQETREKIGRETALQKKAMQRKMRELTKPHEYLDGSYDLPILDSDKIKEEIIEEKDEDVEK